MKKLIALILALTATICSIPITTSAIAADDMWTGEHTWNGAADGSGVDYAEALYFEEAPTLDGYISEAEWGKRTLEFHSDFLWENNYSYLYNSALSHWDYQEKLDALVWLRWDENYFYVAALVRDYNGHALDKTRDETYNGDSLVFRIDSKGSRMVDSSLNTWSNAKVVPEFIVGYTSVGGGYTNVHERTNGVGLIKDANPVFDEVLAVVAPSEDFSKDPINYSENSINGYTTYEIAIPWKYIFQNDLVPIYNTLTDEQKKPYTLQYKNYDSKRNRYGGIGYKLGMSLSVFSSSENNYVGGTFLHSTLGWGTGIYINGKNGSLYYEGAGSNEITLVADKVEVKEYKKYDPSVLDKTNAAYEYDQVFYDYLNGDTSLTTPYLRYDKLSSLTYDKTSHLQYWGSAELYQGTIINIGGEHGNVLNYDRVLKSYIDSNDNIHEAGVDPIEQFYIDTSISWYEAYRFPLSYTLDLDVMYTSTDMAEPNRASELGTWFGGSNSYEYYCGYDFEERAFVIRDSFNYELEPIAKVPYELEKDTWYNWKFQYDDASCTARLFINDEQIFDVQNKYFIYTQNNVRENGCLLIWWFINTQIKMDNVRMYNFYDYSAEKYDLNGSVKSAYSDNGGRSLIYVNLYRENYTELLESVTLLRSEPFEFKNLFKGNYTIEITQKNFASQTYDITIGEDENILNAVLSVFGDADFDGKITASDSLCLKKYFANISTDKDVCLEYSDMNQDGIVNAKDLLMLRSALTK